MLCIADIDTQHDSGYNVRDGDDDDFSSTTSLDSEYAEHIEEHGRTCKTLRQAVTI